MARKLARGATFAGIALILATIWGMCGYALSSAARDPYGVADRACMDVRGSENQACIDETLRELQPIIPLGAVPILLGLGLMLASASPVLGLLFRWHTLPEAKHAPRSGTPMRAELVEDPHEVARILRDAPATGRRGEGEALHRARASRQAPPDRRGDRGGHRRAPGGSPTHRRQARIVSPSMPWNPWRSSVTSARRRAIAVAAISRSCAQRGRPALRAPASSSACTRAVSRS